MALNPNSVLENSGFFKDKKSINEKLQNVNTDLVEKASNLDKESNTWTNTVWSKSF